MASDALTKVFARKRVKIMADRFIPQKWVEFMETEKGKNWLEYQIARFRAYAESR